MTHRRDPLLLAAALGLLGLGVLCTVQAMTWIGQPFAGFLVLDNGVVASAGLSTWPATAGGEIYQYEIVEVDGRPLAELGAEGVTLSGYVAEHPIGTPIQYRLRSGGEELTRRVRTRIFTRADFGLLFGAYMLCGFAIGGVALCIRFLRGRDRVAYGTFVPLCIVAVWALTAMDLYGPARLFRLHALCESLLFAGIVHMAMTFPSPWRWIERHPRWIAAPYAFAGGLAIANQVGLYAPHHYVATHLAATSLFGVSLLALIVSQVTRYFGTHSFDTRQRVKVLALGAVAALGPQVVVALWSGASGGRAPQNLMAFTGVLFPISIGYAVLYPNLMDVDEWVRRSLHYALFTLVVAAAYAACFTAFDALFHDSEIRSSSGFALTFGVFSVLALMPLRHKLQRLVDLSFFRTSYDFNRRVEQSCQRLASVSELQVIADELTSAVGGPLQPEWIALYHRRTKEFALTPLQSAPVAPEELMPLLEATREATTPFDDESGRLAVPFRLDGKLCAVLILGPRRSGRPYTGGDRRLLQTLANQGAVAIQNAFALEEMSSINHELEWRVANRTRELSHALAQLRDKNELLLHLSTTDAVTNLRNRAFLDEALGTEFERARRYESDLSILMVDIDHFKQVNDRYGHQVGDRVLKRIGELIAHNLRSSDVAGRFGGEEFLVILTQSAHGAVGLMFAERLRGSLEHESFFDAEGNRFRVTLSVGVSTLQSCHQSGSELVGEADAALYRAKTGGRNRVETQVKS